MNLTEILTPLVTAAVGYLIVLLRTWVLAHTTPRQFSAVSGLAAQAVAAVHQLNTVATMSDDQKYSVASDALVTSAKRLGLSLKSEEVNAFIHSALHDFKQIQLMQAPMPLVQPPA